MAKRVVAASDEVLWVLELPDGFSSDTRSAPFGESVHVSSSCSCTAVCPLLAEAADCLWEEN